MHPDEVTISDIEGLEPDHAPDKGPLDRRELFLGCALLLIVLCWAGWQWWQQDSKARNYRLGQEAEKEYRWTEARSDYTAASGYRDAAARATSVSRVINELQDNFVSARWYAQGGDWAAALRAVQAVHRLDPDYGDVTSLDAEARRQVYGEALGGAVAMRPQAKPPGLYLRTETGWTWLEGSDQESSVRSLLSSGALVYDVPLEKPQISGAQEAGQLEPRRLMATWPGGDALSFAPLSFVPALYDFYMAGDQGIWAVRTGTDTPSGQSPWGHEVLRDTLTFEAGREIDYQALGDSVTSTVRLQGPEWTVLNADLRHGRLLLAHLKTLRENSAVIDVYMSDAIGDNRRLLYSHEGALGSTQFSPDGRYVLLSTYSPLGGATTEKLSLVLLDVRDGDTQASPPPAQIVSEKVVATGAPGSSPYPAVRATFLRKAPWEGMLLVAAWGAERATVSVLDPTKLRNQLVSADILGAAAGKTWVSELDDGAGIAVSWQPWLSRFGADDSRLVVARFSPGTAVVTQTLAVDKGSDVVSSVVRGDYLVCTAFRAGGTNEPEEVTIYSLPLFDPGNRQPQMTKLHSTTISTRAGPLLSGFSWRFGSKLLTYVDRGQLHAVTYDGAIDVPLETGVSAFFDFEWVSPTLLIR